MVQNIIKRDGRVVEYNEAKIANAIAKAMKASGNANEENANKVAAMVTESLEKDYSDKAPDIEAIQDTVEKMLMESGNEETAKQYILYRAQRTQVRESNTGLMKKLNEIIRADAHESNLKRDNANVDGDTAMGSMLQMGAVASKEYYAKYLLTPEQDKAYISGDIHIHDFDFYALTMTCCQIDLLKLFKDGFSTGHGFLREPNSIASYAALAAIAIQANQNDQHGGQAVPNFDYGLAPGVVKTFRKNYRIKLTEAIEDYYDLDDASELVVKAIENASEKTGFEPRLEDNAEAFDAAVVNELKELLLNVDGVEKVLERSRARAWKITDKESYQAMEGFIHNLNTMHSRAGAQTPFSSINYGMDTTPEGRMVMRNIMLATEAGLGHGETPIFPIQIFRVKEGISYNPEDKNYDLFKLACRVSAKRLFPNFSFVDAPFNLEYYDENRPETQIAYMGCRTRVMANTHDPKNSVCNGRGNLSFTSINLPRIAIEAKGDEKAFYTRLDELLALCSSQLLDRLEIQSHRKVKNFPFLMGQGVWLDSDKLHPNDEVGEVIKHGTLSVGFIGLAETLVALYGHHHGESEEMQAKGLEIIGHMREYMDDMAKKTGLNFSLLATPAEGLSGRFVRIDKKRYGIIPGVTDKDFYTNGFHVPVYYDISAFDKIKKEAPYHALTNAGHISYIELDGDTANNIEAFESVVRAMHDAGIGYGSINHPVDRCPKCGYNGIIGDNCPICDHKDGDNGYYMDRIRRITGYLVGTLSKWNDAKQAEEKERVKHSL